MMNKTLFLSLALVTLVSGSVLADEVYNLSNDWAPAGSGANPSGAWTYGNSASVSSAGVVANTAYEEWMDGSQAAAGVWWGSASGTWPLVWKSFTMSGDIIDPGDVVMQSGVNSALYSVVRWTAPHAGVIDATLFSQYGYGDYSGALLFNGNTVETFGAGNYSFSQQNIAVNAGDTFDFFMSNGSGGSNMLTLDATMTYVPEPATMSLLAMGAVAGLLRRKLR